MHAHSFSSSIGMASRSLYEHIASDSAIGRYTAHAARLLRFQRVLEAALPPALRPYARVANLRADKLVIHASNASVAAKIRQLAPRLGGIFASEGAKVNEIDVRVQVDTMPKGLEKPNNTKLLPSETRRKALTGLAQQLPEGSPLKDALRRLVHTLKAQ